MWSVPVWNLEFLNFLKSSRFLNSDFFLKPSPARKNEHFPPFFKNSNRSRNFGIILKSSIAPARKYVAILLPPICFLKMAGC